MAWLRAALGVGAAVAVAAVLVSGGSGTDPRGPQFLEIPLAGRGLTAVVDSYGDVVGLRGPGPAARAARRWVGRARPLGAGAPRWARWMYLRSLLVLRALTDRRSGAVAAGARDGWAYVWPRDAGAVALAFAAAGYRPEARRVARFLLGLDLVAAARFHRDGTPVEGREAQGDARGWVEAAARVSGVNEIDYPYGESASFTPGGWRGRADYQEKSAGDYLANAIATAATTADGAKTSVYPTESARRREGRAIAAEFGGPGGVLVRRAGDAGSGVDTAVAWAVRPFPRPALFPAVRRSLHRLLDEREGRFGIVPSEDWPDEDPWTAPTAWTAWAFAALGDRRGALELTGDLRRAATPLGLLPERVDAQTGAPRSTTPLTWSHAFAILALQELWP